MTDSTCAGLPVDIAVVLPGDWWSIPVADQKGRAAAIDRLLGRQFRGIDDQPLLKSQLRRKLSVVAAQAGDASARFTAISLMEAAGVPVAASLTAYWMALPSPASGSYLGDLSTVLLGESAGGDEALPSAGAQRPSPAEFTRATLDAGQTLRRVRVREAADLEAAEVLQADYWIEIPGQLGLVQLAFSTPMVIWREPMLTMFDAIASSAHWRYQR
ncbi:MAG: hypothetical protein ACRCYQ_15160 [Nocardioides sp.]